MSPSEKYCDYYGMLSYADYLLQLESGTLTNYSISAGQEKP